MTHYSATSLEQIADELERLADEAEATSKIAPSDFGAVRLAGQCLAFREAATLVRNTRLADPMREAAQSLIAQAFRLLHRPQR